MRIVFDGRTIRPRRTGVGHFVEHLLRALVKIDQSNEYVILLNDKSVSADWNLPANFSAITVSGDYESHPWGDLWERFALPRLLEREKADLFHGAAFRVPHVACRCPTIVTVYDLTCRTCAGDYPWRFAQYMQWQIRRSCKAAAAIAVCSQSTANDLRDILRIPASKIHVIYGAADERFRPAQKIDRQRLSAIHPALENPYILTVGTLEPRKRIALLVRIYERLCEKLSRPLPLVIVGKIGWKAEPILRALKESPRASQIHHLDYISDADLPAIYQGAALYVSTSHYEGFNLPALEAMACGIPVVATPGGATAEIVGDGGIVAEEADEDLLARTIVSILEDEDSHAALRDKALRRAAQFSWTKSAEQALKLYERAAISL